MPLIRYVEQRFAKKVMAKIEQANAIIAEYDRQGFSLTLRQLYYQFVARGFLPNKQIEYKRLGHAINAGRLAGLIDWYAIEDRTRNLQGVTTWDSAAGVIDSAAASFRMDKWEDQPVRPEVWIEKEALVGVIEPTCVDLQIDFFACRGYTSQSEQWRAARRFADRRDAGQETVILHFGDHDPSGIDMTRDNDDRLALFLKGEGVEVRRLALNMNQVRKHKPPPNPAKFTDSRINAYVRKFGKQSWELDALDPPVIAKLIRDAVDEVRDMKRWRKAVKAEKEQAAALSTLTNNWSDVSDYLKTL